MMKLYGALYVVIVVLSLVWAVQSQASVPTFDCGDSTLNSRIPRFTNLAVFPNPARVGQEVHVRAVVQLYSGIRLGDIKDGLMTMELSYNQNVFAVNIPGIPLCNSSSSIVCSTLGPGENAISFDYLVPEIPAGKYRIVLRIQPNKTAVDLADGCVWFEIDIQDPDADPKKFVSWIEAKLAGDTHFENQDYMKRSLGEVIQVGPIGPVSPILAYTFEWGRFVDLKGSGDLVQPYFIPGGYVWGLDGDMIQITYNGTSREHVYQGHYYVGWVSTYSRRTLDVQILTGSFTLVWDIVSKNGVITSNLTGNVTFDEMAELPMGFSNLITVGYLSKLQLNTNAEGVLIASGTKVTCLEDTKCNVAPSAASSDSDDMPAWQIGLITAVVVGFALLFLIVIALVKWHRKSKRHEEEDGIFSVARKPEYGNALVVDDIIQETREHSPKMLPPLSRGRQQDYSDDESEYSRASRPRSRSRTPEPYTDRSRTPSRSRSRSGGRSYSDDDSDYTAGSSASRG